MGGKLKFGLLMSWFLLVETARVGATVWLSDWTDSVDTPGGAGHGPMWYLTIYTIISAVQVIVSVPLMHQPAHLVISSCWSLLVWALLSVCQTGFFVDTPEGAAAVVCQDLHHHLSCSGGLTDIAYV